MATVQSEAQKGKKELIIVGTSHGEILQMQVTPNNSVIFHAETKYKVAEGHAVMSICGDRSSDTFLVGTSNNYILHFRMQDHKLPILNRTHASVFSQTVNSIVVLKGGKSNFYAAGLANGLVRIFDCQDCHHLVDIQAHSRAINAMAPHSDLPIFATVGDDTMVNVWSLDVDGQQAVKDVKLI